MKYPTAAAAMTFAFAITGCSGEPAPEPVEQIIVREPGAPDPQPTQAVEANPAEESPGDTLIAAGQPAFAVCSGCHVVDSGAASTAGPNLHAIVGKEAGARDDFAYSEALMSSGIVWTEAELDAYLADPSGKLPGTTMVAGAVQDAEQRTAIIAYLKSLTDS